MSKIRVLIADDHAIVRAGIRLLVAAQPDMEVVGEATTGREALAKALALRPDVLLMDISMPELSGLEATRTIKISLPEVQILALTMHENERYFFQMIHQGASGYVVKGAEPEELLSAIRAVAEGQAYLSPSVTKKLLDDYVKRVDAGEEGPAYATLTEREREVLRLVAEGYTGREIAELLTLSVHTVERHRTNIMAKLGLHGKADLIKYAIAKGLIRIDESSPTL